MYTQLTQFDQFIDIIDMVLISIIDTTHINDAGQCFVNKDKGKACHADNRIMQKKQQLKFYYYFFYLTIQVTCRRQRQ